MLFFFKIEANEISKVDEHTYYNNICWKLKKPCLGITHFIEHYDDVSDCPDCFLGVIEDDNFKCKMIGEMSRGIDETYVGFGGVYFDVYVHSPEVYFRKEHA